MKHLLEIKLSDGCSDDYRILHNKISIYHDKMDIKLAKKHSYCDCPTVYYYKIWFVFSTKDFINFVDKLNLFEKSSMKDVVSLPSIDVGIRDNKNFSSVEYKIYLDKEKIYINKEFIYKDKPNESYKSYNKIYFYIQQNDFSHFVRKLNNVIKLLPLL